MSKSSKSPLSARASSETSVKLQSFDNSWYHPGRSVLWRALWMFLGLPLFRSTYLASSSIRVFFLRLFGANIGERVVIRSHVNIKYPWHLTIGNDCWIGEQAWIDNLCSVSLGDNVCISQGAYLCTGNHDWSDPSFGLKTAPIEIRDGVWVGAKTILLPGVRLGIHAIAAAGSVVTGQVPDNTIVMGNPARPVKRRTIRDTSTHLARSRFTTFPDDELISTWEADAQ